MAEIPKICPACGAPIDPSAIKGDIYECPFCGTQTYLNQGKVLAVDQQAQAGQEGGVDALRDAAELAQVLSRFQVGQTGNIRFGGKVSEYSVYGRLMYEYDGGYWSEWYLVIGGQGYWLQEDEGLYLMFFEEEVTDKYLPVVKKIYDRAVKAVEKINEGRDILMTGRKLPRVKDDMPDKWYTLQFGTAKLVGFEGNLPFTPDPSRLEVFYIDGVTEDGQYYSLEIEKDGAAANINRGYPLDYSDIVTTDEMYSQDVRKP